MLASLDHPNIARLHDGGVTDGGRPYLVMEHVEGTPIVDYAEARGLSASARLDLLQQVMEAVRAAHEQLVVHRDLKPSNVLVTETEGGPQVKLLDFGIVKLLGDSVPVTRPQTKTGRYLMTPSYAAPEQVSDTDVTTRTDVYQLGVLAYELLVGTRPFDLSGKSLTEIERIILEERPPLPSDRGGPFAQRLQGDLETILQKALRKEPARRYQSVEALSADLGRYRDEKPIEARTPTLQYRARKFVQRNAAGVGVGAAFLALVVVAGALLVWQRNQAQRNAERARQEAETAEQVSQYLASLFESADPQLTAGDTVTARDLLREGADRAGELEGQPAVQAEMLHLLGKTRRRLGLLDSTRALLERSLQLRRTLRGNRHPKTAHTLSELALVARDNGQYAEAESLLTEAVSAYRTAPAPRDSAMAAGLKNLTYVRRQLGDLEGAETAVRKALSLQREQHGERHMSVAESLYNLGSVLKDRGRYREAERTYRKSLRICKDLTDGPHPGVSSNYNNLALVLDKRGKLGEAETMYQRALEMDRALYGDAHPRIAATLSNLGSTLQSRGKLGEAETYLRKAVRMDRSLHKPPHPEIARSLKSLGDLFRRKGREAKVGSMYRRADSLYQAATEMYRKEGLVESPDMGHALEALGRSLQARGKYARAKSAYEDALQIHRSIYGKDHREIKALHANLASLHEAWGKPEQAARYRRGLEKTSGNRPEKASGNGPEGTDD